MMRLNNNYTAKHPAAFINAIAEEGTKEEAIEWLQRTWDNLVDVRKNLSELITKNADLKIEEE